VGTGIHGTRYLLEALTDSGYAEKAFILASQETFPGWGYMIKEGATTLWERWEKIECVGMNSHNHIMLGSIDLWFYNAVAGLSLADSGFREILFTPGLFKKIDYARARLRTPCGTAAVSWERNEKGLAADIRIPPGLKGSFRVPEEFAIDTILSTPADGTREQIPFTKSSVLSIGSGWYHIECVYNG
jgi:alpha-L-rhamnosidase